MTEQPRRKRFQIHLSTAVLMMFVAGGLIWTNVRVGYAENVSGPDSPILKTISESEYRFDWLVVRNQVVNSNARYRVYGWPVRAFYSTRNAQYDKNGDASYVISPTKLFSVERFLADILVVLLILFTTWFLCEWLIRRCAARKGE